MFYLKGKNKGQCVHCPSHEVGQDHAKNILKEWRSLSPGVHCRMPGTGPGSSSGGFILGKAGSTGGERKSCRPQTAQAAVGQGPWRMMLSTVYRKGFVHLGLPSTGAGVTWLGGMVRRRQRHHSGLWCDVFTTAQCRGGVESRSLASRKHTLESSDGLCEPVPDQESSNSFSYLVRGILVDCMATLG